MGLKPSKASRLRSKLNSQISLLATASRRSYKVAWTKTGIAGDIFRIFSCGDDLGNEHGNAKVMQLTHRRTGCKYACKWVRKETKDAEYSAEVAKKFGIQSGLSRDARTEIELLIPLDHPNVVHLHEVTSPLWHRTHHRPRLPRV